LFVAAKTQRFLFDLGWEMSTEIFVRIIDQPWPFYFTRRHSEIISGVNKAQRIVFSLFQPVMQALAAAVIGVGLFIALLLISPFIAVAAAAILIVVYLAAATLSRPRLRSNSAILAQASTARVQVSRAALGAIRNILIERLQPFFVKEFGRVEARFRGAYASNAFVTARPRFVAEAVGVTILCVLLALFDLNFGNVASVIPQFAAVAIGLQRILPLCQQIYAAWSSAHGNIDSAMHVLRFLELPKHVARSPPPALRAPVSGAIQFDRVCFAYPGGSPVLTDVRLSIPIGSKTALVGDSGSGKSTFLDLLVGLLLPTKGSIRVGGESLDDEEFLHQWRQSIAYLPQAPYISDTTIRENIAFGVDPKDIVQDRVEQSARRARIHEFVLSLPKGYDSETGDHGIRLSGGQRQRLALARAFYTGAPVVLLDEATSALDPATEVGILDSILDVPTLTVFVATHRIETIHRCDLLLSFEAGTVTETEGAKPAVERVIRSAG
jgi:ABC-type multidrug transport system fused ATPase/permease subunit